MGGYVPGRLCTREARYPAIHYPAIHHPAIPRVHHAASPLPATLLPGVTLPEERALGSRRRISLGERPLLVFNLLKCERW